MVPTYYLLSSFSIAPPPIGPLDLGTIITDLTTLEPINSDCHIQIPPKSIFSDHKRGFTTTRSRLTKGEYGIWAQLWGTQGVGGELSLSHEQSGEDSFRIERLDTLFFYPTQEYVTQSMLMPDVKEYIAGTGYRAVYMVTGVKIARGAAGEIRRGRRWEGRADVGLSQPAGIQVEVGPKVGRTKENEVSEGFEESDDFVIGIQVKRLYYKKHFLTRKPGGLVVMPFYKGATMHSDEAQAKGSDSEILEQEIEESDEEMVGMIRSTEYQDAMDGGITTTWVIPKEVSNVDT